MRSQTGRGAFACATLVAALALAKVAPAVPKARDLALRWSDPSALAATTPADFEGRLSERLGHPAFTSTDSPDALAITWLGTPEQCQVQLQLLRGAEVQGTRTLESPSGDCGSLLPALLTVAALLIEPGADDAEPPPPPPAPAPAPRAQPQPPPQPKPSREPLALLSLGAQLSSGLTPKLELGPALAAAFRPTAALRVGLLGALYFPHQYGGAPGLSLTHDSLALLGCGLPLTGAFGLGVCANVGWHRFRSEGISLPHPTSHEASSWTAGAALRAEWRLTQHWWWVGSLGGDVALNPLYFYFTPAPGGRSILFTQDRIVPTLFLGLTLELP